MTREMPDGPSDPGAVHQIKVHGGIGDEVWVYKKLVNADKPLFVHISNEGRHRPKRSGILCDHLPRVFGWRFDPTTFCPSGQDWGPVTDPACALGRQWSEIRPASGQVLRLECNRHLEAGRRLEDWLPDLPTTHHFEFLPPTGSASLTLRKPYVIFHLAGWPDVQDGTLVRLIDVFAGLAHMYIVGGSYDGRPRRLFNQLPGRAGITLLEDLGWADLFALLTGAAYCFGHASGFTALADVLKIPGVVVNPQQHPRLVGTWNSLDNPAQVHCRGDQFEALVYAAYRAFAAGGPGAWPPGFGHAPRISTPVRTPGSAVRAVAETYRPTTLIVMAGPGSPHDLAAAAVHGALDGGRLPTVVTVVAATADQVAETYAAVARTTRPPIVTLADHNATWEPAECVVVWAHGTPTEAADRVRDGWRRTSPRGVLIVLGPAAEVAARAIGATLRVDPVAVAGASEVYYLSRVT